MRATTVHRTIHLLKSALVGLNATIDEHQLEAIGIMINRAMLNSQRSFHTPEHIFALLAGKEDDPVAVLAALFHDIVYCQVDQGLDGQIRTLIQPYLEPAGEGYRIKSTALAESGSLQLSMAIFGFGPGQMLKPFEGANEFLSTLTMLMSLEKCLDPRSLVQAAACIELTIPFRTNDAQGKTPPARLLERLQLVNKTLQPAFSGSELNQIVERAVGFANSDVENFAEADVGKFLDNTWKLLPETNPELRVIGVYTLSSYRSAIMKMSAFMNNLDPALVFGRHGSIPTLARYEELTSRASRNITTARNYLGYKLLAAAMLEALAKASGGDAPVAYFVGNIDSDADEVSLATYLPDNGSCSEEHAETELFSLLAQGRSSNIFFDLNRSPLACYLFCQLDDAAYRHNQELTWKYCTGDLEAYTYLEQLPASLVTAIAQAVGQVAFTRKDSLHTLIKELYGESTRNGTANS